MSLINDALRRATTQKKHTPNDLPPMEPIQRPQSQSQSGGPGMTVILICFVVAGAVMLGGWSYWNKKYKIPALEKKKAAAAAAAATPNSKTNNNPIARAANVLNKVDKQNKEAEATADTMQKPAAPAKPAPTPATATGAIPVTPTTEPLPKLQAIFYNLSSPSAMVAGKTVHVGDEIAGVKIVEIRRTAVIVQTPTGNHELMMK